MNRTLSTLKTLTLTISLALLPMLAPAHEDEHAHEEDEEQRITVWADGLEVFIPHPPLLAGEPNPLTAFLTLLDGYRAVEEGKLSAGLRGENADVQAVRVDGPLGDGIFLLGLPPVPTGTYTLELMLEDAPGTHRATVPLTMHADEDEAHAAPHGHDEEDIVYPKALQRLIPFSIDAVIEEPIAARITVPAVVEALPGKRIEVIAPARGLLQSADGRAWPLPGERLRRGDPLVNLLPLGGADDIAGLAGEAEAARQRLAVADATLERTRLLVSEGIIAERRLIEAEAEAATARSAWQALNGQLGALRKGGSASAALALRSPLDARVIESALAPGQMVEAGTRIATLIDDHRMGVRVQLLAADLAALEEPRDLRLRRPGDRHWEQPASLRLIHRGAALDGSGVFSLLYEVENDAEGRWAAGLPLIASLAVETPRQLPTIPESALLDDDGVALVMVQHGGEEFERRQIRPGVRAAGRVAVLDGLEAGERVVTRGAYAVMLAGREPATSDHGHSH